MMSTTQDLRERQSTIERHRPLVRRLASRLAAKLPANVELDDLVQAGMIGLMDALSRYEAGQGAQFETFAVQRVRGAMLDELRGADWMPRSVRKTQREIDAAVSRLEQRLQRAPSERETAAELGMSIADYQQMRARSSGTQLVYLDELMSSDGEAGFLDRDAVQHDSDPSEILRDDRFRAALIEAIEGLPERERMVMGMYYEGDLNLREIGAVLGVTESRVCQLRSQAVARLRTKLKDW